MNSNQTLPKIKVVKMLEVIHATDSEGEAIPFDVVFVTKDGKVKRYEAARLAENVKKELPLQLRRSREKRYQKFADAKLDMSTIHAIKRLYVPDLDPPFRNCWFRSITEINGREVLN